MIHGFAQCSDVWFEAAFQMALNGYVVHLIDLEGYGLSSGSRICKLKVEKFHH
jgi:pimeloyl-ACP methyl ester carboxylesterase